MKKIKTLLGCAIIASVLATSGCMLFDPGWWWGGHHGGDGGHGGGGGGGYGGGGPRDRGPN
ncbi:hypothetical protein [Acinetobacter apis]|uniref:Lipoprotein n=1 Tax=Acinetobacter apis TaxID=1229165 RepID=A0A217EHD1_9GAMM|nr:hypothetical protein [Acinetobacter apis]SNQ29586.1 hypothetical protein SAMN05444584_1545 [Acinetobacter apis]